MKYSQSLAIHMMNEYREQSRAFPHPTREQMDTVFSLCRSDQWASVLQCLYGNPWAAMTPMIMDNHISTTILHQAITSKGDTAVRAQVIQKILETTPRAASIKNGYGSLPLHVIAQRNTKMDAQTKEKLIFAMVNAYKGALMEEGGVGKRTPLHIIFTDYISPRVTGMMIEHGPGACFMLDKKGYLPAHVACSRHCSPQKLRALLSVNPSSLYARTNKGETLLSLATSMATKSHPNYALIDELNRQLHISQASSHGFASLATPVSEEAFTATESHPNYALTDELNRQLHISQDGSDGFASLATPVSAEESEGSSRGRLDSSETVDSQPYRTRAPVSRVDRKRKSPGSDSFVVPPPADADLLLHFARNKSTRTSLDDEYDSPSRIAQV